MNEVMISIEDKIHNKIGVVFVIKAKSDFVSINMSNYGTNNRNPIHMAQETLDTFDRIAE